MERAAWSKRVLPMLQRAGELLDAKEFAQARDLLLEAESAAKREGVESEHLHCLLAYAFDGVDDHTRALAELERALEIDPLSALANYALDAFVDGMCTLIADPRREPDDPSTPVNYGLIVRCGGGDSSAHRAMARYCAHTGDGERAVKLLESLTALDPLDREAWLLLESIARERGDRELAARAEIEVAATAVLSPAPFAAAGGARC